MLCLLCYALLAVLCYAPAVALLAFNCIMMALMSGLTFMDTLMQALMALWIGAIGHVWDRTPVAAVAAEQSSRDVPPG